MVYMVRDWSFCRFGYQRGDFVEFDTLTQTRCLGASILVNEIYDVGDGAGVSGILMTTATQRCRDVYVYVYVYVHVYSTSPRNENPVNENHLEICLSFSQKNRN